MTHQDQREVMRQMKEKVKRVGEMPSIRQRFGITFIANNVKHFNNNIGNIGNVGLK